jgi:hypothetical protein
VLLHYALKQERRKEGVKGKKNRKVMRKKEERGMYIR